MNKEYIALESRILFMLFAAAISITGVWINIKIVTLFGAVLWIVSSVVNVIYSAKNSGIEYNLSKNLNVHKNNKGI